MTPPADMLEESAPPTILLLESNPIIATDMIGALEAAGPCHIIHLIHSDAIIETLARVSQVDVAFLEMIAPDLAGSEYEAALSKSGAQIVLTQGEAYRDDATARGWHMVVRPFTDEMLRDLLVEIRTRS